MIDRVIRVPASFEQAEEIMEHFLSGAPIKILSSERPRLIRTAQRQFPGSRITNAELDVETADWQLTLSET